MEHTKENHDSKHEHHAHEKSHTHAKKTHKKARKQAHAESAPHKPSQKSVFSNVGYWQGATAVLAVLFVVSLFTGGFAQWFGGSGASPQLAQPSPSAPSAVQDAEVRVIVLNDERCEDCMLIMQQLMPQLNQIFPNLVVEELDYTDEEGLAFYEESGVETLPALLFDEAVRESSGIAQVQQFLVPQGDYLLLNIGSEHDPTKEICDDGIDNTGDGLIDCESPDCEGTWHCLEKKERPHVELFVMSLCPYGTQMQKAILPALEVLGDDINFEHKFVNYAMRAQDEIDEQLTQFCVAEEYGNAKLFDYLNCFLEAGNSRACINEAGIDSTTLDACIERTDEQYGITESYNDQSQWLGQFPPFNIHKAENELYGVRGSPHLVINGVEPPVGRNPQALLDAMCHGFIDPPEACSEPLPTATPSPGFGFGAPAVGAAAQIAQCG
ncbi:MAG: hypothetical protein ACMXYE_02145 [Candidatus Woesearchaeota archaeon]